jgi:CheY-like chemotaxis protein
MKKILILGVNGFIGHHLSKRIIASTPWDVYGMDMGTDRIADLPESKRVMLERLHGSNEVLRGRQVLVVDDDARNIFALTSVLENQDMHVLTATNGRQAIELIETTPGLSVVLMDIMMPEMDGYETMREIRKNAAYRTLPILALTDKAMKGDREK